LFCNNIEQGVGDNSLLFLFHQHVISSRFAARNLVFARQSANNISQTRYAKIDPESPKTFGTFFC
jgi:hypothetical protein